MSQKLILLTKRFPYFKTEAFLEAEIKILANAFEEVVIVPAEISQERRQLPDNVKVNNDFSVYYKDKRKRVLQTFFTKMFWKSLVDNKSQLRQPEDIFLLFKFVSFATTYMNFFKKNTLLNEDVAIVYSYWFNAAPYAMIKIREGYDKTYKVVSRAHRYDIYEGISSTPRFWPYRKNILESIDCVFSISENGKTYIEDKYEVYNKIKVAKLGVFDRGNISPDTDDDVVSIVSVSRVDPMKRVGLIAESITKYASKYTHKKIVWTHFGDGRELPEIKRAIPELSNLKTNLNGAVPNSQIYSFYKGTPVSIFMNLSSSEGIPVSIMEAQSFGIPVIATNVGGSGEIVNREIGILLPSNPTIQEVVEAIHELLERNLSKGKVKEVWKNNFNAETNYNKFISELKTL
ncbi:Glycosyltransferase involved in cell wall bisynthesis [Sinomicrobium oceani]|uniref:Glycosyltransferase involved in cell wall bisynthesis n=1 Tax=Sinomicrobium oceani TaxID=1150368 RepID=A0A1K1R059_9FLAO|nr:glycosyltransferase [Sinomicrobium oceani]SFW65297.1 Glycosyltransferase involved in cell wall bisynthesis [Sinomicrobium oceani]